MAEAKKEVATEATDAFKGKNLWERISYIQFASLEIQKTGLNNFQKYNYKTFSDIKRAVFQMAQKAQIVFLPMNTSETMDFKIENSKEVRFIQRWKIMLASDPNQFFEVDEPMIGQNDGGLAKAYGSAITYGLKYLFNKVFLLPDETLDPDTSEVSEGAVKVVKNNPTTPKTMGQRKEPAVSVASTVAPKKDKVVDYKAMADVLHKAGCKLSDEEIVDIPTPQLKIEYQNHKNGMKPLLCDKAKVVEVEDGVILEDDFVEEVVE